MTEGLKRLNCLTVTPHWDRTCPPVRRLHGEGLSVLFPVLTVPQGSVPSDSGVSVRLRKERKQTNQISSLWSAGINPF